jgi:hypothetical protein
MKKFTTVFALFVLALFAISCDNKESLQEYLVSTSEKKGFVTIDVPINFIKPKTLDVSDDVKETINSIRKVNLVALPYQGNEDVYETEKENLKAIFQDKEKYKSLMRMNTNGMKVNIYYTGDTDSIDEVIAFGYAKDQGVGVARILGDNMNPSKMIEMLNNIKFDGEGMSLKNFNLSFTE